MFEKIPEQVFTELGMDLGDKADELFLKKRYRTKSKTEVFGLIPKVLEMKRNNAPVWRISFVTGVFPDVIRSILSGDFMKKPIRKQASTSDHIFKSEIEERFGLEVAEKVKKGIFPYDNIRATSPGGYRKKEYRTTDIIMAKMFEDKHLVVAKTDDYKSLSSIERVRLRYRVERKGIVLDRRHLVVKKNKKDEIEELFSTISIISGANKKEKQAVAHG